MAAGRVTVGVDRDGDEVAGRDPEGTRARLVSAAEHLFASRGIDAVSLREINRAAGARNAVAVQYHFDDRAGVVQAILDKHQPDVDRRRTALLESCATSGSLDLRLLAGALVRPLASKLADPDGGPAYLQIYADLVNRPRPTLGASRPEDPPRPDSLQRWRHAVGPLLAPNAMRLHRRFTAIRFVAGELGRRAASAPHTDDRLFVSHLVDLTTAVLAAPVSPETIERADERDLRRRPAAGGGAQPRT